MRLDVAGTLDVSSEDVTEGAALCTLLGARLDGDTDSDDGAAEARDDGDGLAALGLALDARLEATEASEDTDVCKLDGEDT